MPTQNDTPEIESLDHIVSIRLTLGQTKFLRDMFGVEPTWTQVLQSIVNRAVNNEMLDQLAKRHGLTPPSQRLEWAGPNPYAPEVPMKEIAEKGLPDPSAKE